MKEISFQLDEKTAALLAKVSRSIDKPESQVIQTCLLLSLDTIKANPYIVFCLKYEDRINK